MTGPKGVYNLATYTQCFIHKTIQWVTHSLVRPVIHSFGTGDLSADKLPVMPACSEIRVFWTC